MSSFVRGARHFSLRASSNKKKLDAEDAGIFVKLKSLPQKLTGLHPAGWYKADLRILVKSTVGTNTFTIILLMVVILLLPLGCLPCSARAMVSDLE